MGFSGAFTALVTPFKNGKVDEEAYRNLIEWQIEQGIHGVVPCGTTGESATLSHEEHENVIRICVDQVKKRVPVIAGAGSNNTKEAISLTRFAKEAGADAALHITPYYNKPTQDGLYQHFKAISAEVALPVIMYNVPSRTGCCMTPETTVRIAKEIPHMVGIKEATGSMPHVSGILEQCPAGFQLLSGDDGTAFAALALGSSGVISVVSNIVPGMMAGMCDAFFKGNLAESRRLHYALEPLNRVMFVETNPIPVKTALAMMGKMAMELRLPLVPLQPKNEGLLRDALKVAKLI